MIELLVLINVVSLFGSMIAHSRAAEPFLLRGRELGLVKFDDLDSALGSTEEDRRGNLVAALQVSALDSDDEALREMSIRLTRIEEVEFGIFVSSLLIGGFWLF